MKQRAPISCGQHAYAVVATSLRWMSANQMVDAPKIKLGKYEFFHHQRHIAGDFGQLMARGSSLSRSRGGLN